MLMLLCEVLVFYFDLTIATESKFGKFAPATESYFS